jgi:hypothetical protein
LNGQCPAHEHTSAQTYESEGTIIERSGDGTNVRKLSGNVQMKPKHT